MQLSGIVHICLTRKEQAPLHPRNSSLIPPTHTHMYMCACMHSHTHTHAHTNTHTRVVGPEFHLSQCQATEGGTLVVRLSAPILTRPQIPAFNGSIEVDITAEDLPQPNAQFGKCHPPLCIYYNYVCLVSYCPFCIL